MVIELSEIPDKVKDVQTDAAAANSVTALRDQVVKLAEAVESLQNEVNYLRKKVFN